ncbi:MAG: DUF4147 domain-containing protein [Dehalococcoidales bacterium]|nr:DUF4147 domain-containing protein [Dehalococcoidales bacterium]
MLIKNFDALATTGLRRQALALIEAGIESVLPTKLMQSALQYDATDRTLIIQGDTYRFNSGRLFVIGGGKASGSMAETLEEIIPPGHITAGVVNTKGGHYKTKHIKINTSGHPIPDRRGIKGVKEMLEMKQQYAIDENDLVICLLSGGGSALMPCPVANISLEDKQKTTDLLLRAGADITEINAVRKHLSQVKGGQLGRFFAPAKVVSIIISDVIGNDLSVIASCPTYPDSSTFADVNAVMARYLLLDKIPPKVADYINKGLKGEANETPKATDNCRNYIIGDNRFALEAMQDKAKQMGLKPCIVTAEQKGETTTAARMRAKEIIDSKYAGFNVILLGGETTPKLPVNAGKGGRNQHYALASMLALEHLNGEWIVASVGTDGSDYLADVAGAIVDRDSLRLAGDKNLNVDDYLDGYDSYNLFKNLGNSLVVTGDTGTNVGDIVVYVLHT